MDVTGRCLPNPVPTTADETTCVVLAGTPTSDETRMTLAELVLLVRPSSGRRRVMREPIVLTIVQPPSAVPNVSAAPQTSVTHTGAESEWIEPCANSRAATTPMAFWASFDPWLIASQADVPH